MVVLLPLGLSLIGGRGVAAVRRFWVPLALAGAVSLWLPRGWFAVVPAALYLAVTLALAACALPRWREPAVATALASPAVAGAALVSERAGVELFGFHLNVLSLTVAHFHVAGFTAALIAGLAGRSAGAGVVAGRAGGAAGGVRPAGRSGVVAAAFGAQVAVPVGVLVVLVGFFTSEWVELGGAAVLTAGMWLVAWLTWYEVRPRAADRATRALLGVAAGTLVVTMVLALSWALGEASGLPHPSLGWMAATHGVANTLTFGLCAVLAWHRLGVSPL
jgi:hypothetical protein